ncbi:MAG: zinc ribbon domain-containing protein [Armatimonadetes bacterium]|nr:zinc ribbon domain-containing protein [Armatimonadota bacterium]
MLYFLVFLIEGFIVWKLIGQAIEKDMPAWEAAAYIGILLVLTAFMVQHMHDPIGPTIAFTIIGFGLLHNVLAYWINQSQLAAIRAQDMRDCERMIRERPELPYPYQVMGDMLMEREMFDEAASYYKKALSLSDDPEVKWKLKQCEEAARRKRLGLRLCPQCLSEVPRSSRECPHCGHYLGIVLAGLVEPARQLGIVLATVGCVVAAVAGALALARVNLWLAPLPILALAAAAGVRTWHLRRISRPRR